MPDRKEQLTTESPIPEREFIPMSSGPATETWQPDAGNERNRGSELLKQAKTATGEAYDSVAEKASTTFQEKKVGLTSGLNSIADGIRRAGDSLAQTPDQNPITEHSARYANTAAQKLQQAARYFETNDFRQMRRDTENFARRNPALFLGGAFVLGMLAARFLKSSPKSGMTSTGDSVTGF